MITIKRWDTGGTIIEVDVPTLREAVEYAAKHKISLRRSNLSGSNLSWSDLSGSNLSGSNLSGSDLSGSDLSWSDLSWSDLSWSDLSGSNLSGSDLRGSNLSGSDLSGSNLSWSDLSGSDLSGSKGLTPYHYSPLLMLLEQPAAIRAYKLVTANGEGPFKGGIRFEVGQEYLVADANCDPLQDCGAGINVATMDWCLKNWQESYRILVVEFLKEDIAAIPYGADGKFRLKKCKVVREVDMKKELNWPQEEKKEASK